MVNSGPAAENPGVKFVKVNKEKLVQLFQAVSYPKADKWSDEKLISQLPKLQEADPKSVPKDKVLTKLYKKVLMALAANEEISLDDETEEVSSKPKMKNQEAKEKEKAKSKDSEPEEDGEPKKRKQAASTDRPGIVQAIVEVMKTTSKKNSMTTSDIMEKLKEKFPDRDENAMRKTLSARVPNGLKQTHDMDIGWEKKQGEPKRYWLNKKPKEKAAV